MDPEPIQPPPEEDREGWEPGMLRLKLQGQPPDVAITATFLRFGSHLRRVGIPATTGRMLDLLRAMPWIDLHSPDEFFWASRCMLTERLEDLPVFDRAFMEFFMPPRPPESRSSPTPLAQPRVMPSPQDEDAQAYPSMAGDAEVEEERVGQSVRSDREKREQQESKYDRGEGAGLLSWSPEERLRRKDFGDMTPEELRAVRRLLAEMQWQVARRRSRRLVRASKGRHIDWRRSFRRNIGYGSVLLELERQKPKVVKRQLIVIADVSGSMDRYTRPVMQLVHTMRTGHGRVEAFVFGSRLTRVTKHLHGRDPDKAMHKMSEAVLDWAGGTRIGDSLKNFNRNWGRRLMNRGSIVIILSDGWDRGDPYKTTTAMNTLQRRCHRLIWLNPALGGPTVRPVPLGMKAAMPYIDNLMPARNLNDLEAVGRLLAGVTGTRPSRRGGRPDPSRVPT